MNSKTTNVQRGGEGGARRPVSLRGTGARISRILTADTGITHYDQFLNGSMSRAEFGQVVKKGAAAGALCVVGAKLGGCEGEKNEGEDAGVDGGRGPRTPSTAMEVSTDVSTDTGRVLECTGYEVGSPNLALLAPRESAVLGRKGIFMNVDAASWDAGVAQISFYDVDGQLVDENANPASPGEEYSNRLKMSVGETRKVNMGGESQTIKLCAVQFDPESGKSVAYFTTDYEGGFLDCELVDRDVTRLNTSTNTVNSNIEQTTTKVEHEFGFVGDDPRCNDADFTSTRVSETYSFNLPLAPENLPSDELSYIWLDGKKYLVVSVDPANGTITLARGGASASLEIGGSSLEHEGFEICVDRLDRSGKPVFGYIYSGTPGEEFTFTETVGDGLFEVRVKKEAGGEEIDAFMVKFAGPNADDKVSVHVYKKGDGLEIIRLENGGTFSSTATKTFDVSMGILFDGIESVTLTVPTGTA